MTITIIGHGYVGLVTACVFADFGNEVWIIGHNKEKIEKLKKGDPIIYEPGLEEILKKNLRAGRLHFTLEYEKSISSSKIVFITVGTPPKSDGQADLSAVFEVAKKIAKNLGHHFTVISCKSTVPIGTNKKVEKIIKETTHKNAQFAVASCPEFLKEGTALADTLKPDRIVIGSSSTKAINLLLELHQPLNGQRVICDLTSAELIKYTANAMLATKISFANLISFYCEKTGADVEVVLDAVGLDKRIGRIFMNPGLGYGGSCLPKDVMALINIGKQLKIEPLLLEAVEKINQQAKENFLKKILKNIKGKKVAIWGLSFKPNTDDIRFAPSIEIIKKLLEQKFQINVFDPAATVNIKKIFGDKINYFDNQYSAANNVNALLILTEWNDFKRPDFHKLKKVMKNYLIFDGRNLYQKEVVKKLGFEYYSIGR